jgi:hypothetical protein
MFPRLLAMLAVASALAAQTAPEPARVSGTVANSLTGEPILRAHVVLTCDVPDRQPPQQDYGALTNEKGDFSIGPVPPARCSMSAERAGFVKRFSTENLALASGAHKEGLKLSLTPTGSVTGRVLNVAGEPVEGINVSVEGTGGGSWGGATDEKGEFHIGGLAPGKYRVRAAPQQTQSPPEVRSDGTTEEHYATTYYPETLDAKTAERVEVKAGAETSGVVVKLVQTPIVRVSGQVIGVPAGHKGVVVMTQPRSYTTGVRGDGSFAIWRMDPGKYSLQAHDWGSQSALMSAPAEIEVATANVDHVELRLIPPFDIAGQVRFDDDQAREAPKPPTRPDGTAAPAPPPEPRQLQLLPFDRQFVPWGHTDLGADDSFTFEKMQPAKYRVEVLGLSGYVRSIRAGDVVTDGSILDARNGAPGPVTVVVSSKFCVVSGAASDDKGPLTGAQVILQSLEDPTNVQFAQSDSAATYKFRAPPGKYRLALVDPGAVSWGMQGPDLEDYQPQTVELSAGDKITKDLIRK